MNAPARSKPLRKVILDCLRGYIRERDIAKYRPEKLQRIHVLLMVPRAPKWRLGTTLQEPVRPRIDAVIEALVVRVARENSNWGYDRIVGALANLGHHISDQTIGNILKRHGMALAPKRSQGTSGKDFLAARTWRSLLARIFSQSRS
jgi:hypothetical protein